MAGEIPTSATTCRGGRGPGTPDGSWPTPRQPARAAAPTRERADACGAEPEAYDFDGFLRPRRELLGSGQLAEFSEQATSGRIDVFGDVAHWWGGYTKSWTESATPMDGRGMKSLKLVRVDGRWRISALAWDDERDDGPLA